MIDQTEPADTSHPGAPPDWTTIAEEIHCPLCSYNLRGLIEPRCPECGYRCEWSDLLDPSRRLHPYLFEHHPEKNVSSFIRTTNGALRPGRFWKSLHPVQPSNRRRLVSYWLVEAVAVLLSFAMWMGLETWHALEQNKKSQNLQLAYINSPGGARFKAYILNNFGSISNHLELVYPTSIAAVVRRVAPAVPSAVLVWTALIVGWPWLVFLSSLVFTNTMRRIRLNRYHLLRASIYSFDALAWMTPLLMIMYLQPNLQIARFFARSPLLVVLMGLGLFAATLLAGMYRYVVAFRDYLRFPSSTSAAASVLFIALLASANIFLLATVW